MNRIHRKALLQSVLALALLAGSANVRAQLEVPEVISPLRVETDHNGVNVVSGKTQLSIPVLSVPAAPNLRFDYVQNAAPYVSGKQRTVSGAITEANYSVHTITGTSESFLCPDLDCTSITGTGSVFIPNANFYSRGGSGERYWFNLESTNSTVLDQVTLQYYASSVTYQNGEVISFTYDTATLAGDPFNRTFYRPTRVTSNLGFFITIAYHPGELGSAGWNSPAQAALYSSAAPTTPLGRLT